MTVAQVAHGGVAASLAVPHHDGSELYVPAPPEELGARVDVRVLVPEGSADDVYLRYVEDGEPRTVVAKRDGDSWWRAELPVRNEVVRYRWLLAGGTLAYRWLNGRGLHAHEVPGSDDFVLTVRAGGPDWHLSSVVYQVFPDRFASSGTRRQPPDWAVPRPWDALPEGRGPTTSREWFGGDLPGIEQRLDHIEALGANVVYLTPIFPAGSTHRYDATSFDRIDPLLGGNEGLTSLARAAHARGMRLIGDLTLNHCGAGHEWFVRARGDAAAPEQSFFFFGPSHAHGYAAWLDVKSLPSFDWRSEELRGRMAAVLRRWLDAGLDGWRIDVANMVGRHRDVEVNHDVAHWTRAQIADALLVAEHGHDYRPDLDGRGWHGVMNYAGFLRPVWWWLAGDTIAVDVFAATPAPRYTGREAVEAMGSFRAGVPWQTVLHSWTLLDSHDTARFRTVAGSRDRHVVGVGLQATLPGVPMVYAGDEIGLEGEWGEDARRTMPWDRPEEWDTTLLSAYRSLLALRRSSTALARGGLRYVHVGADAVAYLRETANEQVLCLAARAAHDPIRVPFTELETLYGEDARDGILPADGPAFHVWRIRNG